MAEIKVTIRGRAYPIACEDGQESHIETLAGYVDQRAEELISQVGEVSPQQLMVMVSLLVADELSEAYARIRQFDDELARRMAEAREETVREWEGELATLRSALLEAEARARETDARENHLAPQLAAMAERINALAARLESD